MIVSFTIALLIYGVGFVLWFYFMRGLGAFKTKDEIYSGMFYICANCGKKIYWSKPTPIPDRHCPYCGVDDFQKAVAISL